MAFKRCQIQNLYMITPSYATADGQATTSSVFKLSCNNSARPEQCVDEIEKSETLSLDTSVIRSLRSLIVDEGSETITDSTPLTLAAAAPLIETEDSVGDDADSNETSNNDGDTELLVMNVSHPVNDNASINTERFQRQDFDQYNRLHRYVSRSMENLLTVDFENDDFLHDENRRMETTTRQTRRRKLWANIRKFFHRHPE